MTKVSEFAVGDIVKLKSGGPEMTVKGPYQAMWSCQWFAGKKLESGIFPSAALEKIKSASSI